MHNWCTHLLTCHVLHMTHARYLLLTCLALLPRFWDFVYVLFRALCLFLWANLDLTKFVFLFFVFALVSLLCVYSFQMYHRSSRSKEPVTDLTSSPVSKRTWHSSNASNNERFKTPLDSQTFSNIFQDVPTVVEWIVRFDTLGYPRLIYSRTWRIQLMN